MTKVCSKCAVAKPLDAFGKHRGICKPCRSAANSAWNSANAGRVAAKMAEWRDANRTHIAVYGRKRREEKADVVSASYDRWRRKNLAKRSATQSARRAMQLQATPPWLSALELAQIEEFYEVAACVAVQTGKPHHVDHIVPLQGETVRGLHVPWNLQVLSAPANASKKNRVEAFA